MEITEILNLLNKEILNELIIKDSKYFILSKIQENLYNEKKWRRFVHAPKIYWDLLKKTPLIRLEEVANLSYGIKTGKNEFFYLKEDDINTLKIPSNLIKKLIKSVGQLDYISFKKNDTEWYVLNLEPLKKESEKRLKKAGTPKDLKEDIFDLLREKNLINLLKWIRKAEKRGWDKISSVKNRRIWFSLGDLQIPPLVYTKEIWKKNIVYLNDGELVLDQHLYNLYPKEKVDKYVLLGILNSDITAIFRDLHGRIASGQALNRIENTVQEAKDLLIIDPRKLSQPAKNQIKKAIQNLIEHERSLISSNNKGSFFDLDPKYVALRSELNHAVLDAIEYTQHIKEVEQEWKNLINLRIKMGGMRKQVLIKRKSEKYPIKLSGSIEIDRESGKLPQKGPLDNFF